MGFIDIEVDLDDSTYKALQATADSKGMTTSELASAYLKQYIMDEDGEESMISDFLTKVKNAGISIDDLVTFQLFFGDLDSTLDKYRKLKDLYDKS